MRYFVVLAETLHFGRAAERLHLTQPPLSRQIAALEQSLGVRLLERDTRHVRLTPAGRRFLEDAKATLLTFEQACHNARLAERGELGELKVGFMMHAAFTVVPGLARRFLAVHPQVRLQLSEAIPSSLPDDILSGHFDAGIVFPFGKARGLSFHPIHSERLCLAVPAGHRLTDSSRITPRSLKGEALIAAPEEVSPSLRAAIMGWFGRGGSPPPVRLETQLQQTILSLVGEGLGLALVPESMQRLGMAGVEFSNLERAPRIEHGIAWRQENLNPSLPLFLKSSGVAT